MTIETARCSPLNFHSVEKTPYSQDPALIRADRLQLKPTGKNCVLGAEPFLVST